MGLTVLWAFGGRPPGSFFLTQILGSSHMFKTIRGRLITILIVVAISLGYLYTNNSKNGRPIKLGLDLQGGMHVALEVDDPDGTFTDSARADHIDRAERILRTRIDEFGVEEPLIQKVGSDRLVIELAWNR